MKKAVIFAVVLCLMFASCKSLFNPTEPEANLVLDGDLVQSMTSYDCPVFIGYVKNTGTNIAYNCMVAITCFSDAAKTTIIDTANGFPANLGDIAPDQRAYFEAVCFDCDSWAEIAAWSVHITWLDRSSGVDILMETVYNF